MDQESFKELILSYILGMAEQLKEGAEFLAGELPLFINELLMWHGVSSFLIMVGFIFYWFMLYKGFKFINKHEFENNHNEEGAYVVFSIIAVVSFMITMFMTSNIFEWVKILVAPRVWLVEFAHNFLS